MQDSSNRFGGLDPVIGQNPGQGQGSSRGRN
jgi:hypothetical protein